MAAKKKVAAKKAAKKTTPATTAKPDKKGTAVAVVKVDPKTAAKLNPIAHEINERMALADTADKKAGDHRLAAALKLAEAKKLCEANGVVFKLWCEGNVKQSFHQARKLAVIGASPEPAKALADFRLKNTLANQKHRAEQHERREATVPENMPRIGHQPSPAIEGAVLGVDIVKKAFDHLKASEKMEFMEYAAEQIGVKLDMNFNADHPFAGAAAAAGVVDAPAETVRKRKTA